MTALGQSGPCRVAGGTGVGEISHVGDIEAGGIIAGGIEAGDSRVVGSIGVGGIGFISGMVSADVSLSAWLLV